VAIFNPFTPVQNNLSEVQSPSYLKKKTKIVSAESLLRWISKLRTSLGWLRRIHNILEGVNERTGQLAGDRLRRVLRWNAGGMAEDQIPAHLWRVNRLIPAIISSMKFYCVQSYRTSTLLATILKTFLKKYIIFNLFRAIAASAPVAQFTAPCDAFGRIVTADYSQQVNHF
jgi:hypothetical protein